HASSRCSVRADPESPEQPSVAQGRQHAGSGSAMPEPDLIQTGVRGLDRILGGGLPRGNLILVEGAAGTGKTTFGGGFIYRGAADFDEPGLIVLFEVSPERIMREAARLGWDLAALERQGRLKMVFTTRQVFEQELRRADSLLLDEAREIRARRVFVDSF